MITRLQAKQIVLETLFQESLTAGLQALIFTIVQIEPLLSFVSMASKYLIFFRISRCFNQLFQLLDLFVLPVAKLFDSIKVLKRVDVLKLLVAEGSEAVVNLSSFLAIGSSLQLLDGWK